jgi:hypothetical protein
MEKISEAATFSNRMASFKTPFSIERGAQLILNAVLKLAAYRKIVGDVMMLYQRDHIPITWKRSMRRNPFPCFFHEESEATGDHDADIIQTSHFDY